MTLSALPLPPGISSRQVEGVRGLSMHLLEAGEPGRPVLLLLHGFPELAFSWRKIMPALAAAGYHVLAPDQRGYGRTTGWDGRYEADLTAFSMPALVEDARALLAALGIDAVAAVIGHDFGSPVAAWCALLYPQQFRAVALMSAPFGGPPLPVVPGAPDIHAELARLPRPRKHYQWYYSTPQAERDMLDAPQGLLAFMRAYYHSKSADWAGNQPHPLKAWRAEEIAQLPTYYVMDLEQTMAGTVEPFMPDAAAIAACAWLPDHDLQVYCDEYARAGFQGGLQWYRCGTTPAFVEQLRGHRGKCIDVPALFISGASDWGTYQKPGEFERMQASGCAQLRGVHLVPGAGHWVQQEQPAAVSRHLLDFLQGLPG